jgi:hypothetical protein
LKSDTNKSLALGLGLGLGLTSLLLLGFAVVYFNKHKLMEEEMTRLKMKYEVEEVNDTARQSTTAPKVDNDEVHDDKEDVDFENMMMQPAVHG